MKKINSCCFLILLLVCASPNKSMALDYYWVGGTGNWSDFANHWATSSGGSTFHVQVPQTTDNVFFDANSFTNANQTVTVDRTIIACADMSWAGSLHSPSLSGSSTNELHIYGSLQLISNMFLPFQNFVLNATSIGKTITSAGKTIGYLILDGIGGEWTLLDDLNCNIGLSFINGTFNTNNKTLNVDFFSSGNTNNPYIRRLNLGSSIINTDSWSINHPGMIFNAGTSTINVAEGFQAANTSGTVVYYDVNQTNPSPVSGSFRFSTDGGVTFHDVSFAGGANIERSNTYNNLRFSAGKTYTLLAGTTQTVINDFIANGSCTGIINIVSSTATSQSMIRKTAGVITTSYTSLKDIMATGGASFTANNSIDLGNNTGWTIVTATPQDLYWVGGAGNWNDVSHWSTSSGGTGGACLPSPYDNVFFNAGSGFTSSSNTVTININNVTCANMDWTGSLNNPLLTGNSSNTLHIYGSLRFISGMRVSFNNFLFEAVSPGKTITSAGQTIGYLILDGIGGEWTLLDDLNSNIGLSFVNGTFNTNNKTLNVDFFSSGNTNNPYIRRLNLGSSIINTDSWSINHPGMIFNAGTSTINVAEGFQAANTSGTVVYYDVNQTNPSPITGSFRFSTDGGVTFHDVSFAGGANIERSNTYNNLRFSAGKTYTLLAGTTQTVINDFIANGSCTGIINIVSSTATSQSMIRKTAGVITTTYTSLKDIMATGGASFTANNSIDLGNNTGWTIVTATPQDLYWVGGAGNWNDVSHWSTSSGGPGGACLPSPYDNVFFNAGSGFTSSSNTVTININNVTCANMDWTGSLNNPLLTGNSSNTLHIYGSLRFISGMRVSFNNFLFEAVSPGKTITSAGQTIGYLILDGIGGEWTLLDDLNSNIGLSFINGTFNTNNKTLNVDFFSSGNTNNPYIRRLNLGSSIINTDSWSINHPGMIFNAGTSTINVAEGFQAANTSGTVVYYDVNQTNPSPITGSFQFSTDGGVTFHDVSFAGGANIERSNTYNNLRFSAGKTYTLLAGTTQTIIGNLLATGIGGFPIRIQSSTEGTPATFFKASGTVCLDFIRLTDSRATGGAAFYAGPHSEDISGNSGWIFGSGSGSQLNLPSYIKRCNNDSITITAAAGFANYTWSPNYNTNDTTSNIITIWPAVDTFYILTAANASGCAIASDTVRVGVFTSALIHLGNDTSLCENTSVELNAGDGFTNYTWSNGGNGARNTVASVGMYKVLATDANGCISEDSLSILNIYQNPLIDLGNNKSICEKTILLLDPGDAFAGYLWQDGAVSKTYAASAAGLYWVEVQDGNNCKTRDSLTVLSILPSPTVKLGKDTSLCNGDQLILNAATQDAIKYVWNDNSVNSNLQVNNTGVYSVQVTDANNCMGADTITIEFKNCDCNVTIPNAFTPNNDGFNDTWKISRESCVLQLEVSIYNRYGSRVFYDRNYQDNWRGTYGTNPLPDATYYYTIKIRYRSGRIWTRYGDLTILR